MQLDSQTLLYVIVSSDRLPALYLYRADNMDSDHVSVYLVQSVGWGVLPIPHHEAARPRPQHVPRLRLRPAVILLRLVLGVDDCNEAGIGGVSEGGVGGVCQQLWCVPGGCNPNSVRGNSE